jgi:microcin C transport system substrate-binding protein
VIKEEAKKAGIDLQLNFMDGATSFKSMLEKQHQVAWTAWSGFTLPQFWEGLHSENAHKKQTNNFTNTDDPEMDRLIMAYRNEFNDEKKQEYSRKIQQREFELAAYIPTFLVPYIRAGYWRWIKMPKIPGVNDINGSILSPFWMGRFWVDEKVKDETLKAMKSGKTFPPVEKIDKTYKKS